ncbi:unnamed protein product [Effrenium voratum]|uniref:EF-hand domain-containing protein n=1 Tax=Effrenium voratum TaxID=2562239 RepID=A0AA36I1K3_9DINO|nr:unnamed protein product [Effrenium voratum]CAJ1424524.1 unnamed protein product [Effrenium voratum]|mmetsp:Transcript_39934/g.95269  ORF Transcript_39934/g.95269 Transcript_39934/m.95269 type:complete len:667 (-) Transcript_39934:97-2097(-)
MAPDRESGTGTGSTGDLVGPSASMNSWAASTVNTSTGFRRDISSPGTGGTGSSGNASPVVLEEDEDAMDASRSRRTMRATTTAAESDALALQEEVEDNNVVERGKDRKQQASEKAVPFVETQPFAMLMAGVVLANSVVIGLELELAGKEIAPALFSIVNNGFLLIYMCEIFLRFLARGLAAIRDALTCLDIALVLLTFVERMAAGASMARSLPSIRLLRLLRLIRAFKRMRKSKELVVLLSGTSKAARTLCWVSLILFTVAWIAAACTRQVVGNSPVWNGSTNPMMDFEAFMAFDNREYFGNMPRSFLSMIQVITNAQWANHIGRPIILRYPALAVFFAFFLLSTTFGLVTCIISNIVQDSLESSRAFDKVLKELDRENRRLSGLRARQLLLLINEDGTGELSQTEVGRALENEEFVEILRALEVPVMNSENLMRLFDTTGRGQISFTELVQGITSMLEDIHPKDYTKLALWSDSLMKRMEILERRCTVMAAHVVNLRRKIEECFNCLALFLDSRENTELYYRALRAIRSAPPPVPVDIREALGLEIKDNKVKENEAEALMNFARRYIAPKQQAKKKIIEDDSDSPTSPLRAPSSPWHTGLRVAATLTCHKAVLSDPPPAIAVDIARKMQEQKEAQGVEDQYAIRADNAFRPTQKFSALKDLLGGM